MITLRPYLIRVFSDSYNAVLGHFAKPQLSTISEEGHSAIESEDPLPLQQADFPDVKFWYKRDWLDSDEKKACEEGSQEGSRGKGRLAKNINVSMRFVEKEDGQVVDGDRASEIRIFAQSIWVTFEGLGIGPSSWGQANMDIKKAYFSEMNKRFHELRLCHSNWKADHIATKHYSRWHVNWLEQQEDAEDPSGPMDCKCSRKDSMKAVMKRLKSETLVGCHHLTGTSLRTV